MNILKHDSTDFPYILSLVDKKQTIYYHRMWEGVGLCLSYSNSSSVVTRCIYIDLQHLHLLKHFFFTITVIYGLVSPSYLKTGFPKVGPGSPLGELFYFLPPSTT